VWDIFVRHPSEWWGAPYTLLDRPGATLTFPVQVGQPVIESAGAHQAAWGTLSEIEPGSVYAWHGTMGMGSPSWGEVRYAFADADAGTRVTVTHRHMCEGVGENGDGYDFGWADLNHRLQVRVENGTALGLSGANAGEDFTFRASIAD
jgi:hypothetical protein